MGIQRIRTKRLVLKPSNNDVDLSRYLTDLDPEEFFYQFGYEYDERLLEGYSFDVNGVICYSVFLAGTDVMVGYVGIKPHEVTPYIGDLEYYIFKEHRGMGYCQEAVRAMIELFRCGELNGTEGTSVYSEIVHGNDASAHILENLGFINTSIGCRIYAGEESDSDGEELLCPVWVSLYELVLCPAIAKTLSVKSPQSKRGLEI